MATLTDKAEALLGKEGDRVVWFFGTPHNESLKQEYITIEDANNRGICEIDRTTLYTLINSGAVDSGVFDGSKYLFKSKRG